jgi:hypothetical protein
MPTHLGDAEDYRQHRELKNCNLQFVMWRVGDQIGRIFAQQTIVFFGQFFLITEVDQIFGLFLTW